MQALGELCEERGPEAPVARQGGPGSAGLRLEEPGVTESTLDWRVIVGV